MENKDVYSAAGNEDMETKTAMPGYVPAPLIRSDFPEQGRSDDGDATVTADDADTPGTPAYANRNVDTVGRSDVTADPETDASTSTQEAKDAESKKTADKTPPKTAGSKSSGGK